MSDRMSLDGRTFAGVANDEAGEVSAQTTFHFEETDDRLYGTYAGGPILDGHLLGTREKDRWEIRYVQINEDGETSTGHSIGEIHRLDDGRLRIEDQWHWESKEGTGESVLEEMR